MPDCLCRPNPFWDSKPELFSDIASEAGNIRKHALASNPKRDWCLGGNIRKQLWLRIPKGISVGPLGTGTCFW
jgi:hypothetical protein